MLRIAFLFVAGIAGAWAGGLSDPIMSMAVLAVAVGIFVANLIPLLRDFQTRAREGKLKLSSGEVAPWKPLGLIVFYLGTVPLAAGMWMLLTVLRSHGELIDVIFLLRYGVVLLICGILMILAGRIIGLGKW